MFICEMKCSVRIIVFECVTIVNDKKAINNYLHDWLPLNVIKFVQVWSKCLFLDTAWCKVQWSFLRLIFASTLKIFFLSMTGERSVFSNALIGCGYVCFQNNYFPNWYFRIKKFYAFLIRFWLEVLTIDLV